MININNNYLGLIGKTFNKLTVLSINGEGKNKYSCYCKCECGKEKWVTVSKLINNTTTNCGCSKNTRFKSLIGQKFNRLTAIKLLDKDKNNNYLYLWKCDCGKEITSSGVGVKHGSPKSCGCQKIEVLQNRNVEDLTGFVFGKLTIIKCIGKEVYSDSLRRIWLCKCECGNDVVIKNIGNLKNGNTQSCGCLNKELIINGTKERYRNYRISKGKDPNILLSNISQIERDDFKKSDIIQKVLKRDNYTCQFCPDSYQDLEIHHIKSWSEHSELRYEETNLITLCKICHIPIIHNGNPTLQVHEQTTKLLINKIKQIYEMV